MERIDKIGIVFLAITLFLLLILFVYPALTTVKGGREPPHCQYGDVNGDGVVTSVDAWIPALTWSQKERADVTNDGVVDATDFRMINDYANGLINNFPVGDRTSSSYQYDMPPFIESTWYEPQTIYVGDKFKYCFVANDTNGETLKVWMQIYNSTQQIYSTGIMTIEPGKTVCINYTFENAGTYFVKAYCTYRYRTDTWHESIPTTIEVKQQPHPPPPPDENKKPVANFTYIIDGLSVTLYDKSYDLDGYIVNWTWELGDGSIAYGKVVSHTYSKSGTYTVKLTVTDNDGMSASVIKSVRVEREHNYLFYFLIFLIVAVPAIIYVRRRRK